MPLSLLSTAAMLRIGKVAGGRMIDLTPTSAKLRRRAVRMVVELAGVGEAEAERRLEKSGWRVRGAIAGSGSGSSKRTVTR